MNTRIEAQQTMQLTVKGLECKLESLLKESAKQDEQRQNETYVIDQIRIKYDCPLLNSYAGSLTRSFRTDAIMSNLTPTFDCDKLLDKLDSKLSGVQDKVVARYCHWLKVLPTSHLQLTFKIEFCAILSAISKQAGIENAMLQLKTLVQSDLNGIRGELNQQGDKFDKTSLADTQKTRELLQHLQQCEAGLMKTQDSCQKIEGHLELLADSVNCVREEAADSRLTDLTAQLLKREARITELEEHLRSTYEHYAAKIEELRTGSMNNEEETRAMLQRAATNLRQSLDQGFEHERQKTEASLQQNEIAMTALGSQLRVANSQLEQLMARDTNDNVSDQLLRKDLEEERTKVIQLKQQVTRLENEAKVGEQLHDRWNKDIRAIDTPREHLKAVQERMPGVHDISAKLDRIVRLNGYIQSTTSYLASERNWVHQQLEERVHQPRETMISNIPILDTTRPASEVNGNQCAQAPGERLYTGLKRLASQDVFSDRKVTVYSPAGHSNSPSPPPSIRQEQQRRRHGTHPRSILKHSILGETGPVEQNEDHSLLPTNMRKHSLTAAVAVAEIRSGMIQPCDWSLPSVANFERDNQLSGLKNQTEQLKRKLEKPNANREKDAKMAKVEKQILWQEKTRTLT